MVFQAIVAAGRRAITKIGQVFKGPVKPPVRALKPVARVKPTRILPGRGVPPKGLERVDPTHLPGGVKPLPRVNVGGGPEPPVGVGTGPTQRAATAAGVTVITPEAKESITNRLATLSIAAQSVQQLASSFTPSLTWSASVSCRGYKSTSLRTVLHYALAVAYGLAHQSRPGTVTLRADLHHMDNSVDVHVVSSTMVLLELGNFKDAVWKHIKDTVNDGGRKLTAILTGNDPTTKKFDKDAPDDQKAAAQGVEEFIKNIAREVSGAAVWDMAQSSIFAGTPSAFIGIGAGKTAPFSEMYNWGQEVGLVAGGAVTAVIPPRPLLTRELTANPEHTPIPQMNWPTHYDLKSLVAQALYEPGVLPPVPDTNIALAEKDLP